MTNTARDPQWRETATDSDLIEHAHRVIQRLDDHAKMAQDMVSYEMIPLHVLYLTKSLSATLDELTLRTDDRELMDATRPAKPEPPADPLLDLLRDIEDAEQRGDVTPEGGVILHRIPAAAPGQGEHVDGLAL
jgi:hypothetical protein